jgi:hypothetical protein
VVSRRLPIDRANTTCRRRDARVIGAVPAMALRPLAVAYRCGSSPNSASTRAPSATPSPGWLCMIPASQWAENAWVSATSNTTSCSLKLAMTATAAATT